MQRSNIKLSQCKIDIKSKLNFIYLLQLYFSMQKFVVTSRSMDFCMLKSRKMNANYSF